MDAESEAKARELFFAHEGSTFYMSRNGVDREFEAMRVPMATKRRWLEELTAEHLASMSAPGGWRSVNFLLHHETLGHLQAVVDTAPQGEPWERSAYLELAFKYVERCTAASQSGSDARDKRAAALKQLRQRAQDLMTDYRMRGQSDRLTKLVEQINAATRTPGTSSSR